MWPVHLVAFPRDEAEEFPFLRLGARYYDPEIGRFLQRDPIGINGGLNVYVYVASTPTMVVGPSGKFLGILIGGAIAGTGVGAGVAGAIAWAVGGAGAGALGGYGNGKGAKGIAFSAGVGGFAGALAGGLGGKALDGIGGGNGSSAAAGASGSITSAGLTIYYDDWPSAIACAAERLGRSR